MYKRRRSFVCDLGYYEGMPLAPRPATTPECEPHTPEPAGYVAWHEWAEKMMETHTPRRCRGCGLWMIWEPRGEPPMMPERPERPARTRVVTSPSRPRPLNPLTIEIADMLRHIERNYGREGSGPGSRFEGRLLEDVQAEAVMRRLREKILQHVFSV